MNQKIEIEKKLQALLTKYKLESKLTVPKIKSWIFHADEPSAKEAHTTYQAKWMQYFRRIKNIDELNDVMQIFVDAWNYFPHKALGNKSPQQMIEEYRASASPHDRATQGTMPRVRVGGREMSFKEYQSMLIEMERAQKPFKQWVENDLLKRYKTFLEQQYKTKTVAKHIGVAQMFFDRVLHVGFVSLGHIRADFIQKEFPRWWQTHVMFNSLQEKEILSSLRQLFMFIGPVYEVDLVQFGFARSMRSRGLSVSSKSTRN